MSAFPDRLPGSAIHAWREIPGGAMDGSDARCYPDVGLMGSQEFRDQEHVWGLVRSTLVELGVPRERITEHATIADDLGLESVAFVELQVTLEDELGVEIDPIHVVELNELSAVVRYLCELPCTSP